MTRPRHRAAPDFPRNQLPHDLEAERSLLGAALVEPGAADRLVKLLEYRDWFRVEHAELFATIAQLRESETPVTLVTVKNLLVQRRRLDAVGGAAYLVHLTTGVPVGVNMPYYARLVRGARERCDIIELSAKIATGAHTGKVEPTLMSALADLVGGARGLGDVVSLADDLELERRRREVRRRVDAEERVIVPPPPLEMLRERLMVSYPPARWRIENWQPIDSRVMLIAQYKAGKTTLVSNLVRDLVDGGHWLDRDVVHSCSGSVALLDFEMSPRQLNDWYRSVGVREDDRIWICSLRGSAGSFDIREPRCRTRWASELRSRNVGYVVLDCLRPVLDALGLDEHKQAGQFLTAFDALLEEAGVPEACIVHHAGHQNGQGAPHVRARGDSRLLDWPDITWTVIRETEDASSARFIKAYGRDVDIPEQRLVFHHETRRLTISGGSRRDEKARAALAAIERELLNEERLLNGSELKNRLEGEFAKNEIDAGLKLGVRDGRLTYMPGLRNAKLYARVVKEPHVSPASQVS